MKTSEYIFVLSFCDISEIWTKFILSAVQFF